jgi:hypothetical protein
MRKYILVSILVIIGLLFWVAYNAVSQKETNPLLIIKPPYKRTVVSNYLSYLFCTNEFGYSLIGAKAVSFTIDRLPTPLHSPKDKYPVTFCNTDNFLFRSWKSRRYFATVVIELINKRKFVEVVDANKEIFQEKLGNKCSGQQLLNKLASSTSSIFDVIKCNETLLGILLGFGKENSMLFERMELLSPDRPSYFVTSPNIYKISEQPARGSSIAPKANLPRNGFKTIDDEINWMDLNFNDGSFDPNEICPLLDMVYPVGFRIKDSDETKALIAKYTKAKLALLTFFKDRDCLDTIVEQLYSKNPVTFDELPK